MSKNVQPFSDEQRTLINNITKEHSIEQLAWLSGYLWGVVTNRAEGLSSNTSILEQLSSQNSTIASITEALTAPSPPTLPTVTVLSASQTGNARRIAQDLSHDIERLGYSVKHVSAGDYKFRQIDKEHYLIIVTSTQGEGEPPEEALALYKYLFSKKAPTLNQLYFSVLGLGDASYINFCHAGKEFDRRLEELGAKRIVARVDADTDYQTESDQWRQHIVDHLLQQAEQTKESRLTTEIIVDNRRYHRDNPFIATVSDNQKITAHHSIKDIRHIELDLTDSGIRYLPGDSLGVWYKNSPQLVAELLTYLQLAADTQVTVNGEQLTLEQALTEKYELTQNTPNIVKQYATLTTDKNLLMLINDIPALHDFSLQTPIIDMIQRYPYQLNAQDFIQILRTLTPRLYSIASSQDEVGDEAHLTVNLVQYDVNGITRFGGASSYLASQCADQDHAKIFIESNDRFRLPNDNTVPIIMIAAGTGIAPFRAFMQQRASEQATGKNWLFFGNPHAISDFLYQLEWQQYVKDKILTRIDLAWSQDQVAKVYVQDKLQQQASEIWQWLQQGAHLYICGDACTMAKAVNDALLSIIKQHGNLSHEQAQDYLDQLCINRRYQKDTY